MAETNNSTVKFSTLSPAEKLAKVSLPFWAPVTEDPDKETAKDIEERHKQFLRLPEYAQDFLLSDKIQQKIISISRTFNLNLLQTASLARAIRNYFFKQFPLENFPIIFAREMQIDFETVKKISQSVKNILSEIDYFKKKYETKLEKMTLKEALKKYPEIGKQLITSKRISLKNFPEPVRPSIKNWLADYTFNAGYESHNSITRGNYLFQNKNAKILNSADRQQLDYLLKSYDENTPIKVNVDLKQIIFPEAKYFFSAPEKTFSSPTAKTKEYFLPKDIFQREKKSLERNFKVNQIKTNKENIPPSQISSKHSLNLSLNKQTISKNLKPSKPKKFLIEKETPSTPSKETLLRFTSPQKMPFEIEKLEKEKEKKQPLKNISSQKTLPQPLKIIPKNLKLDKAPEQSFVQQKENSSVSPNNIVNLKDLENNS